MYITSKRIGKDESNLFHVLKGKPAMTQPSFRIIYWIEVNLIFADPEMQRHDPEMRRKMNPHHSPY